MLNLALGPSGQIMGNLLHTAVSSDNFLLNKERRVVVFCRCLFYEIPKISRFLF